MPRADGDLPPARIAERVAVEAGERGLANVERAQGATAIPRGRLRKLDRLAIGLAQEKPIGPLDETGGDRFLLALFIFESAAVTRSCRNLSAR
jgi:hypothetical protein